MPATTIITDHRKGSVLVVKTPADGTNWPGFFFPEWIIQAQVLDRARVVNLFDFSFWPVAEKATRSSGDRFRGMSGHPADRR
jgi:hypothetical protein